MREGTGKKDRCVLLGLRHGGHSTLVCWDHPGTRLMGVGLGHTSTLTDNVLLVKIISYDDKFGFLETQIHSRGWEDCLVVKSMYCSCRVQSSMSTSGG